MPLFRVDIDQRRLLLKQPASFAGEAWGERTHLQPLLRETPEALDPDLMIIAEEFSDWEDSARRVDLLGLDRQGNLVVIELKRVENGGHMELQALRYAAMVSAMDLQGVVRAHETFLRGQGRDPDTAREAIERFLEPTEPMITATPRVVLVAPSFSREITTTVLWLNDRGLDIRCVAANLYNLGAQHYLDIEQVIPLPSASEYQVKIREKEKVEREAAQRQLRVAATVEEICELADANGIGDGFRSLRAAAERHGLFVRPSPNSRKYLMYTPPDHHGRSLFIASAIPRVPNAITLWISAEMFQHSYPTVSRAELAAAVGDRPERDASSDEIAAFIAGLDQLFLKIRSAERQGNKQIGSSGRQDGVAATT